MYCFLVHLLRGRGASLRTVTLWLLEKRAGGVFRTLTVSISSMLAFTLWSFYIKICTSGSLKLPCIDVSMQISHSQTTSTIFTAVEVRLRELTFLVHRQAKARMPHHSVLWKMRMDKGKEKKRKWSFFYRTSTCSAPLFSISVLVLRFRSSFAHVAFGQSVVPEENPLSTNMLKPNPWDRAHVFPLLKAEGSGWVQGYPDLTKSSTFTVRW